MWVESAAALDEAQARVEALGESRPGEYLIFCQKTGQKFQFTAVPPEG